MGLDIRWPIGLMFTLIGALLVIMGVASPSTSQALGININLIWGLVLLVFGGAMTFFAYRGARKNKDNPPNQPPPAA